MHLFDPVAFLVDCAVIAAPVLVGVAPVAVVALAAAVVLAAVVGALAAVVALAAVSARAAVVAPFAVVPPVAVVFSADMAAEAAGVAVGYGTLLCAVHRICWGRGYVPPTTQMLQV